MKKNFEMELLNSEEMNHIIGGGKCSGTGDTIWCNALVNVKVCYSLEAKCPNTFSSNCSSGSVTATCDKGFTVSRVYDFKPSLGLELELERDIDRFKVNP